nr:uncharacterized protein LOC115266269 [Aedes albopictus]
MHPNAPDFDEKLAQFQQKLLSRYSDFFKHVKNDFIRMLMIIRQKCPSRGAKRTRDADPAKENILKGIVEWINPEDPYPHREQTSKVLCESQVIFNAACAPTDKQFYVFVLNVFFGIGQLTTTGERLRQSIE